MDLLSYRVFLASIQKSDLLCTASMPSIYVWLWGDQIGEQYSNKGRMYLMNAFVKSIGSLETNPRKNPHNIMDSQKKKQAMNTTTKIVGIQIIYIPHSKILVRHASCTFSFI